MLNKVLENQIKNDKIFHSYILEGNESEVKEQYLEFSKKLFNIENISNIVRVLEPENNNISIDSIRELTKSIFEKPVKYDYNVFVINNAEFMRAEAQNALLKTLEEIPDYSIVFLVTNNRFKLLDTIISRSQTIVISNKIDIDMSDETTKNVIQLIYKVLEGNYYIINKEKNLIKSLSDNKHQSLYILTKIFADAILKSSDIDNVRYNKLINKLEILSIKSIEEILFKIEEIKNLLAININFQMAIEDLIFKIIEEVKKEDEINK